MTQRALRAYLPWQAWELFPRALAPVAMFATIGGIPIATMLYGPAATAFESVEQRGQFIMAGFLSIAPLCMTLGGFLFNTAGLAVDRERQHVRFYFAHPISPLAFYLQRYVIGLLLFTLCFLAVPLGLRGIGGEAPLLGSAVAMMATLVLIGGLAMLCAALFNKDGLALIIAYIGTQIIQQLPTTGFYPSLLTPIGRALPPIDKLSGLRQTLLTSANWPTTDLLLVFGYGLGMLVAALYIIRRAALVR